MRLVVATKASSVTRSLVKARRPRLVIVWVTMHHGRLGAVNLGPVIGAVDLNL